MTSRNATQARNRRLLHTARVASASTPRRKRWQALAWVAAEVKSFADPDEAVALLTRLAAEMNERNATRKATR